ncbi:MAG TPA: LLM class F420-dependent oxidoreductase [Dehalococcoidia bacterium]|nr:LLM class F420-dependent oxidoreductase [Dehalococcoidia bacterium]
MKTAIGFGITGEENWEQAAEYAVEAERMGVDYVWTAEAWGHDAVTPLAYLAAKTSRIKLGAGIMQAVARTPANTAMTAMTLASMSHGRFIMGLGASGPQVVEGWHGVPFRKPIQRIREVIEIVRMVSRGERLQYDGEIYHLPLPGGEGKALKSGAAPQPEIPVYLATLSPKSLELTGEVADGWLGTSFIPEQAGEVFFQHIRRGAEKAGRTIADLDLQAGGAVAFSDDVDRLIARHKPGIAFTLGAMGSKEHNFYNAAFRRAGYEEEALAVQRKWLEGDRAGAASLVPDEMVTHVNLLGTDDMVRARMRAYRDAGVTTLRLQPEGRTLKERLDTLGRALDIVKSVSAEA